ncbi:MarR family winged helix-turn-helix transcriptional regulator [Paenibacillus terreus]|uniref:HTH-type transcriptional regulator MgrA n=1 Tax=Paenibacillus terreus TaxID=1387834 RepID=A0ABV5B9G9_9BACL
MSKEQNREADAKKEVYPELSAKERFPVSFSIFALARSHRALAAQLLREIGLFVGQELMLMQLWDQDHQSQQSLGRTLRLDHSTVAKSVRRLEEAGLVSRSRSAEDGRVTIVSLTQAGRDLESNVMEIWSKMESVTTADLTEQEKKLLVKLSRKISSSIEKDE